MGRKEQPEASELEFIFDVFKRGLTYKEEVQDTDFPPRNKRTISYLKRNFEAARKVLQVNPVISELKKEHFENMAIIAARLVTGISDVSEPTAEDSRILERGVPSKEWSPYCVVRADGALLPMTSEELGQTLADSISEATCDINVYDMRCFLAHLKAEYPNADIRAFETVVECEPDPVERPYEFAHALFALSRRKTFRGTCHVCQEWQ